MFVTCRLGLHISGKLAADAVVVGTDVVKTPASELLGTVELSAHKVIYHHSVCFVLEIKKQCWGLLT